jgi:predicted nucleic acid-binding protein
MRDIVVVDASIALKWVIKESDSDKAQALLDEWSNRKTILLAPALITYEITNILYQNVRKNEIALERAKSALEDIMLIGMEFDIPQDYRLGRRAIELAHKFGIKATYDSHYLALAEREGCELWTADTKMWRAVKGELNWVRWLEDYHPTSDRSQ